MRTNTFSTACTSIIFFYLWIDYAIRFISQPVTIPRNLSIYVFPSLLGLISLFGVTLLILELNKKSRRWYLGCPLWVMILALLVSTLLLWSLEIDPLSHPVGPIGAIWIGSFLLLAPSSVLFFYSFPDRSRKKMAIPTVISTISGVYSILAFIIVFLGVFVSSDVNGTFFFFWLHLAIGLPAIGISMLTVAASNTPMGCIPGG